MRALALAPLVVAVAAAGAGCADGGGRGRDAGGDGDGTAEVPGEAVGGAGDSASDRGADAAGDGPLETKTDAAVEKAAATASWTIEPGPACPSAGVGCMDTGSVGGYQVTATGYCPSTSGLQLWFPGGVGAPAPGSYAVKPASGILDVVSMPAGMVGMALDRIDAVAGQQRYWGRSGNVTVAVVGGGRSLVFSGVSGREERSGAAALLDAAVSCP